LYLLERIEGVEGFFIDPDEAMFKTSGMVFSTTNCYDDRAEATTG
ncbi:MAG: hypothetical protein HIU84_14910, partial [Acidobacteria bacterium]|nr:hypothetical protein [Acidobacteriota bacterium]